MKRGEGNTNLPELLFLKFLQLTYHHSHFCHLIFHIFFQNSLLGGCSIFFTAGLFLDYFVMDILLSDDIWYNWCVRQHHVFHSSYLVWHNWPYFRCWKVLLNNGLVCLLFKICAKEYVNHIAVHVNNYNKIMGNWITAGNFTGLLSTGNWCLGSCLGSRLSCLNYKPV